MSELADKMIAIAKRIGVHYSLKGRPITYDEVFTDSGLMPGLAKRADQLCSLCFGYGIGASFEEVEQSLLGSRVKFDDFTPEVLRILCLTDVLYELIRMSPSQDPVSLDELLYD